MSLIGWTVVWEFNNGHKLSKKNEKLVLFNYRLRTKTMKIILEMLISITYLLNTKK